MKLNFRKVAIGAVIVGALALTQVAGAAALSASQINAIINLLQVFGADAPVIANVQTALSGGIPPSTGGWCHTFNVNMGYGSGMKDGTGEEIQALQQALQKEGFNPYVVGDDGYPSFGEKLASTVVGFQEKYKSEILTPNGLAYGTGYVGAATRKKLNQLYGCGSTPPPVSPSAPVPLSPPPAPAPVPPAPAPAPAPSLAPAPSPMPTLPPVPPSTGFWDTSGIQPAKNIMMFKFLNRTNGKYDDAHVFWSTSINGVKETHSIAEQPYFDMPAHSAGRIYVYLGKVGTTPTDYYDFMEYTIGSNPPRFNGNTTRVDAFGVKLAILLHNADGSEQVVGENAATFAEDRATTFQRFINAVPAEYKPLAQLQAPYRILNPGADGFKVGGTYQDYYKAYIDEIWASNGLIIPKAGPNASGLGSYPNLSAAIHRHTAAPGTFSPEGKLLNQSMWSNPATFYQQSPADYYAKFWHDNAIDGKAYGFPYDDVGGYSSFIAHNYPQYMLVAIGW